MACVISRHGQESPADGKQGEGAACASISKGGGISTGGGNQCSTLGPCKSAPRPPVSRQARSCSQGVRFSVHTDSLGRLPCVHSPLHISRQVISSLIHLSLPWIALVNIGNFHLFVMRQVQEEGNVAGSNAHCYCVGLSIHEILAEHHGSGCET